MALWLDTLYKTGLARPDDIVPVYRMGWLHAYFLFEIALEDIEKLSVENGQLICNGHNGSFKLGRFKFDAHTVVKMLKTSFNNRGQIYYPYFVQGVPFKYYYNEDVQSPLMGVGSWFS